MTQPVSQSSRTRIAYTLATTTPPMDRIVSRVDSPRELSSQQLASSHSPQRTTSLDQVEAPNSSSRSGSLSGRPTAPTLALPSVSTLGLSTTTSNISYPNPLSSPGLHLSSLSEITSPFLSEPPLLPCFWALLSSENLDIVYVSPNLNRSFPIDCFQPFSVGSSLFHWIHPDEEPLARADVTQLLTDSSFYGTEITCRLSTTIKCRLQFREPCLLPPAPQAPGLYRRSSTSRLPDLPTGIKRSWSGHNTPTGRPARASSVDLDLGQASSDNYHMVMRMGLFTLKDNLVLAFIHRPSQSTITAVPHLPESTCTCRDETMSEADLNEMFSTFLRLRDLLDTPISPRFVHQLFESDCVAALRRAANGSQMPNWDPLASTSLSVRARRQASASPPVVWDAVVTGFGSLVFLCLQSRQVFPTLAIHPELISLSAVSSFEVPHSADTSPHISSIDAQLARFSNFGIFSEFRRHSIDVSPLGLPPPLPPPRRFSLNPNHLVTGPSWDIHSGRRGSLAAAGDRFMPKNRRVAEITLEATHGGYVRPPPSKEVGPDTASFRYPSSAGGSGDAPDDYSGSTQYSPAHDASKYHVNENYGNGPRRASAGVLPPIVDFPKIRRFSFPLHARPENSTAAYIEPPAEAFAQPSLPPGFIYPHTNQISQMSSSSMISGGESGRSQLATIPEGPSESSDIKDTAATESRVLSALTMPPSGSSASRVTHFVGLPVTPTYPMYSTGLTNSVGLSSSSTYSCYAMAPKLSVSALDPRSPRNLHPSESARQSAIFVNMLHPPKRVCHDYTGTSSGLGQQLIATPPKKCESCQTETSPEWRRGPSGHKTLCNACGLRYSRSLTRASKSQNRRLATGDKTTAVAARPLLPGNGLPTPPALSPHHPHPHSHHPYGSGTVSPMGSRANMSNTPYMTASSPTSPHYFTSPGHTSVSPLSPMHPAGSTSTTPINNPGISSRPSSELPPPVQSMSKQGSATHTHDLYSLHRPQDHTYHYSHPQSHRHPRSYQGDDCQELIAYPTQTGRPRSPQPPHSTPLTSSNSYRPVP
ncbi:hypothetical protein BJ085DRAFT_33333 [Dimargaris cristalligena]|uniref:GATA-type domain-containing protein n=1 Tax=Dimargaris cristalligena TaxID=215637 RepID=A0A4P9ZZV6_9FUNG|nr:hypothetical protein BJ085DRAFT_33333 [Dimargaris cristalligena]|eukprot:RKP39336.1 hypothetical protein BJ085DRAFT_33333 [Dimargaris cristalligena]